MSMNSPPQEAGPGSRAGKTRSSLRSWIDGVREWKYPKVNEQFTRACFVAPPIAGSAVSVLYNGGALWCVIEVARGRYGLSREPQVVAMTAALYAYCAVMVCSALVNPNLTSSLYLLPALGSLMLFPFSYAIWRVSDKRAIMHACIMASAVACIGGLAFAAAQVHLFALDRAEGGAGNALVFANVIALAGGVALVGAFKYEGRDRLLCIAAYLACALAVVYSGSRAPLIIVVANAVLVTALHTRVRNLRLMVTAAVGAALLLFVLIQSGFTPLAGRIATLFENWTDMVEQGDFASSLGIRVALWEIGIQLFLEKPLLGHGAGEMSELIRMHLTQQYDISRGFSHFHNVFVNTAVEGGLLALLALLAMIAIPIVVALRVLSVPSREVERFGATLLLLFLTMFLITGMTNLVLRHDIMDAVFMAFLVSGLYLAAGRSVPGAADRDDAATAANTYA